MTSTDVTACEMSLPCSSSLLWCMPGLFAWVLTILSSKIGCRRNILLKKESCKGQEFRPYQKILLVEGSKILVACEWRSVDSTFIRGWYPAKKQTRWMFYTRYVLLPDSVSWPNNIVIFESLLLERRICRLSKYLKCLALASHVMLFEV